MKNKLIRSVAEFMEWVAKVGKRGMLYRRLADSRWDVSASIYGRLQENKIKTVHHSIFREMTKRLLARACAEGHDIENHRKLSDLELLAKLQHHGAATCLIDFTGNPLVALWFACQEPNGKAAKSSLLTAATPTCAVRYRRKIWTSRLTHGLLPIHQTGNFGCCRPKK